LNKALKSNLRVYEDKSKKGISQFISLYSESMKQKGAKKFYFFNEDFFNKLFDTFKEDIALFHVELDGKVISSSIELGKYGILHDYLRGCDPNYLELRPNDILIDTIIKWAKSKGYNYFSLGGGASPSEEDGILRFKRSFSSTTSDFYVYKKIHNLKAYNDLCSISGKKQSELKYEKAQFFPEYSE
jgi:CelD/BcsL family acetyltransferase involved in cellulose biosynthesis